MIKNILFKAMIVVLTLFVSMGEWYILKRGESLKEEFILIAKELEIKYPEKVRVLVVNNLLNIAGVTLRYGIIIKKDYLSHEILVHELTHVKQYEKKGGIYEFLKQYFYEINKFGYYNSPSENEARKNADLY